MKFQKGILSDPGPKASPPRSAAVPVRPAGPPPRLQDDRLFETQQEFEGNARNYLRIFAVLVCLIIVGALGVFYFTLPNVGDRVRTPAGLEDAVREHFLSKEKRTATDVVAFKCDGFYWLRVGVETRKDIPNPVYKIGTYSAKAAQDGSGTWQVEAQPLPSGEGTPCQ